MATHRITLQAKNEGLRYEDETGIFLFELGRENRTWHVYLPPTQELNFRKVVMSEEQRNIILPRIKSFLSRIWWLGVWPVRYKVEFKA